MFIDLMKTLKALEKKLTSPDRITIDDLHNAYKQTLRLRNQLLGVIYEQENFGQTRCVKLSDTLSDGNVANGMVVLTLNEALPSLKELTTAVHDHWLEMINTAIGKAAKHNSLPHFDRAFVWIDVTTARGTNNAKLWDTSNRAVNLIINNLKGVFFEDDNLEHMAFGVVGSWGETDATIVRVMSFDKIEQIVARYFQLFS